MSNVKLIPEDAKLMPEDYQTVTPLLVFKNSSQAIDYYKQVFDAEEIYRLDTKENKIIYAEIKIGKSIIMLMDRMPVGGVTAEELGNTPVNLYIYVKNVDETFNKAIKLGAKQDSPVETQFFGDRVGMITDPFGYKWSIATRIKTLKHSEIKANFESWSLSKPTLSGGGNDYKEKYLKYKQKYINYKNNVLT